MSAIVYFGMKTFLLYLLLGFELLIKHSNAQPTFQKRYGSNFFDQPHSIIQTHEGNFILVGETKGFGSFGNVFMMKVDSDGSILWNKDYAGINYDAAYDIIELTSHHLLLCGATVSFGHGGEDAFLLETDSMGHLIWSKAYGDILSEFFYKVIPDGTNGFYLTGVTSNGSLLARLDSFGNILWSKVVPIANGNGSWQLDILRLTNGNVIFGAAQQGGYEPISIWKFSSNGNLIWSHSYTFTSNPGGTDGLYLVQNDTGEILLSVALSNDLTQSHSTDIFILKFDSLGNPIWVKSYGGTYFDVVRAFFKTTDGEFMMSGFTNSAGNGEEDACLIKLHQNGSLNWAMAYGTVWTEEAWDAIQTSNNSYAVCGQTFSIGYDLDSSKIYFLKANGAGITSCNWKGWLPVVINQSVNLSNAPSPQSITLSIADDLGWVINDRHFYTADICSPTAIDPIVREESLIVHPNPTFDFAILKFNSGTETNTKVRVLNSQGKEVESKYITCGANEARIDLSTQSSGLYLVVVESQEKVKILKLIKE